MPLQIEPWTKKTARLSAAARGAYLDLLLAYWCGEVLPANDDDALMRLARCTEKEWSAVGEKVKAYFDRNGDRLTQQRADEELASAKQRYEQKANAGKAGARAKREQKPSKPVAEPQQEPKRTPTHLEQSPNGDNHPSGDSARKRAPRPKTIIPTDWQPNEKDKTHATDKGIDPARIPAVAEHFRDHHLAKRDTSADWSASWRTWVANEVRFAAANGNRGRQTGGNRQVRGDIVDLTARLKAEADLGGQDGAGRMGRGTGDVQPTEHDENPTGTSGSGGDEIIESDDAERMLWAAGGAETADQSPQPNPGGTGSPDAAVPAQADGISGGRGEARSENPTVIQHVVAGVGRDPTAAGTQHTETQTPPGSAYEGELEIPSTLRRTVPGASLYESYRSLTARPKDVA